jgi:hypothetical protein
MNKYRLIFLSLYTLFSLNSFSQNSRFFSKNPIEIAVGSNAVSLPFKQILTHTFYLQINGGLQFNWGKSKVFQLNQYAGLGIAWHPINGNRYFIDTHFRLRYNSPFKLYAQTGLIGAFVLHSYPYEVFVLNGNGFYEKSKNQLLKPQLFGGGLLELGYKFKVYPKLQNDIFIKYTAGISGKHHPNISIFPYTSWQMGLRFYFNEKQ